MTNLTEQWDKGELPNGYYYCKLIINNIKPSIERCKAHCIPMGVSADRGEEVLAPVPSYEEWDKLNNACHELEKETACLTVDNVNLKKWRKLAYDAKPIIIAHQNNAKTLAQKLLQVKPELKEWLEVNFKEYL